MADRTKVIVMVMILSQQLKVWLKHARDMGHMAREFKYLSGILLNALENFCGFLFKSPDDDEEVYEHSVRISDLIEKMAPLSDQDIRRVLNLVEKIKRDHENKAVMASREESGSGIQVTQRR